jgi:hypothetical protein
VARFIGAYGGDTWKDGEIAWATFWLLWAEIDWLEARSQERGLALMQYHAILAAGADGQTESGRAALEVRDSIEREILERARWTRDSAPPVACSRAPGRPEAIAGLDRVLPPL